MFQSYCNTDPRWAADRGQKSGVANLDYLQHSHSCFLMHDAGHGGDISHIGTGHQGLCPSMSPHTSSTSGGSLGEEGTRPRQWLTPRDKQHQQASLTRKDTSKVYFPIAEHHPYSSLMRGHRHLDMFAPCTPVHSHSPTHSHLDVWHWFNGLLSWHISPLREQDINTFLELT